MQQLTEFAVNHWLLVSAFMAVFGLLVANLLATAGGMNVQDAVILINREGAAVVDIRPAAEFAEGHIMDALNIPLADIKNAGDKLKKHKNKPILVYCGGGSLAARAVRELKQLGCERVYALKGGLSAWRSDNLPVTAG